MTQCNASLRRHYPICVLTAALMLFHCFALGETACGQAGLRESLERLDRNQNGLIDPNEITPLARPYLERIAEKRRLQLDKPQEIATYQEAARVYHALSNGVAGIEVDVESKSTMQPFGPARDKPLIPDFGLAEVKYPYAQVDLDEADRSLRRYDFNRDGFVDRSEAAQSEWTHNDPFSMDLDKDDRLSRMEMAQRYARRRILSGAAEELVQKSKRLGNGIRPSVQAQSNSDDSRWWRSGGSSYWLTSSILGRFDTNRDNRLDAAEAKSLGVPMGSIDLDRNGELSRDELYEFLKLRQEQAGDETVGLPGWFYELDEDRDGQIAMAEFATDWTNEKLEEFRLLDSNDDGLLTAAEVAQSKAQVGGTFSSQDAEILPPRKTVISEIQIDDNFVIADIKLQLSITHTNAGSLDAFLTGPNGQRVELFSEVGGSGDNFDQTLFDDASQNPINKGVAPFQGAFMTMALLKRQPSLGQFVGQNSQGIWQLVVRGTRSDRFGMLHNWSLIVKPKETKLDSEPLPDTPPASLSDAATHSGVNPNAVFMPTAP